MLVAHAVFRVTVLEMLRVIETVVDLAPQVVARAWVGLVAQPVFPPASLLPTSKQ